MRPRPNHAAQRIRDGGRSEEGATRDWCGRGFLPCVGGRAQVAAAAAVPPEEFISGRLTAKILRQLQDSLVLCSNGLPQWCHALPRACPFLFPFDTRRQLFHCTAFGVLRALHRLHGQDGRLEGDARELRVGRLQRQKARPAPAAPRPAPAAPRPAPAAPCLGPPLQLRARLPPGISLAGGSGEPALECVGCPAARKRQATPQNSAVAAANAQGAFTDAHPCIARIMLACAGGLHLLSGALRAFRRTGSRLTRARVRLRGQGVYAAQRPQAGVCPPVPLNPGPSLAPRHAPRHASARLNFFTPNAASKALVRPRAAGTHAQSHCLRACQFRCCPCAATAAARLCGAAPPLQQL